MREIDNDVPIPTNEREKRLIRAKQIYSLGGIGKSTAAKQAIDELGVWPMVKRQSAIDYLRGNILEK